MNATNRGLNRLILFVVGLALIGAGAAAAVAAAWPVAGDRWRSALSVADEWMHQADQQTRLWPATTLSWFVAGVLAVLLLIVVIAVVVIARLGRGHNGAVIHEAAGQGVEGQVRIDHGFAADAIKHSLAQRQEILSARVRAGQVRGADVMHVSLTARQRTSPVAVAETMDRLLANLDALTGQTTPTLVSIHSGVRARLAADQSRVA